MADDDLLPSTTPGETAIDTITVVSNLVPWIGGVVGSVLAGISLNRKIERVRQVLLNMNEQIKDLESETSQDYVETEDFEDLLEKTLRQAADERSEEKRRAYAAFLTNDIKSPGHPYDEKLRVLRTLEEIQPDHIRMLQAMMQVPDNHSITGSITGSFGDTLQRRLPNISRERISDLAQQLLDMRLVDLSSLSTMMTAAGAEELRNRITPYGRNFVEYILH